MGYIKWLDEQSKGMKILLFIPFWGWAIGALYRLFKFIETKETASLVGAILGVVIGFIISIIDLFHVITTGNIKLFVPGGESFGIKGTVTSDDNAEEAKTEEKTEEAAEEPKADAEEKSE